MSNSDDTAPDDPLTPEQEARARRLSAADLQHIDEQLLSLMSDRWQKVARIVGLAMSALDHQFPHLPDGFYSLRIKHLAKAGAIETVGNLNRMRHSEVRITPTQPR